MAENITDRSIAEARAVARMMITSPISVLIPEETGISCSNCSISSFYFKPDRTEAEWARGGMSNQRLNI